MIGSCIYRGLGTSVPPSQDPPDLRVSQTPGSPRTHRASQDSQSIPGLPDHPRVPRILGPRVPSRRARPPIASFWPKVSRGQLGSFGTIWERSFAPDSIDLVPQMAQMAQDRARSKMAFWGDLPCEACFAPDSIDLGSPERTLGGATFQSCFAPDSIDLGPQNYKTTSSTAARTLPTTRAGGQDDGS